MSQSTVVHIFQSEKDKHWYWRVRAANGRIIAASSHRSGDEDGARKDVERLVDALWDNATPEYYEDKGEGEEKEWRWRLEDHVGICGSSSEGYTAKQACVDNFQLMQRSLTERIDIRLEFEN